MNKQRTNITLDADVWLYYKHKGDIISSKVNNLLKLEMEMSTNNKDEQDLLLELEELKKDKKNLSSKIENIMVQLEFARSQKDKELKAELERIDREGAFMRQHNPARDF